MQRLLKRTAQAEKQVFRRMKKRARMLAGEEKKQRNMEQRQHLDELNDDVKSARLARAEKWDIGPLAPRRNIFEDYGAIMTNRQKRQTPLKSEEIEARCAWAGSPKYLNIAVKDRVVILEGPDRGQIDTIASINLEDGTVELDNFCKISIAVPDTIQKATNAPPFQSGPMSVPISAIRLVHPVVDPTTGIPRDVVIRSLARGPVKWDRQTGWRSWTRYIPGANIAIPWPERQYPTREDQPSDTKLDDVEEVTFVPTLLTAPMPETVINELRNRYSRFRTRHEDEYIRRKEDEEAEKKLLKKVTAEVMASTRTPLQEFNRQQRDARRARGEPQLTDEMLEKIGEVIARNKARTLNAVGMSEVSASAPPTPQIPDAVAAAVTIPSTESGIESHPPPQ